MNRITKIFTVLTSITVAVLVLLILLVGITIGVSAVRSHRYETVSPFAASQDGSRWVSDDSAIQFQMNNSLHRGIGTLSFKETLVDVEVLSEPGSSQLVLIRGESVNIWGKCQFKEETMFYFEVESSDHAAYREGDTIVMRRVD